jgi:hypothetical protein
MGGSLRITSRRRISRSLRRKRLRRAADA